MTRSTNARKSSTDSKIKNGVKKAVSNNSDIIKKAVYDDKLKAYIFTTSDNKIVHFKEPKTKQLMTVRSVLAKHEDKVDEEGFISSLFAIACVSKWGDKNSITLEEFEELEMVDGLILLQCLQFFRPQLQQLQSLGLSEK